MRSYPAAVTECQPLVTPTALCVTRERASGQIDAAHNALFWAHSSVRRSRSGLRSESAISDVSQAAVIACFLDGS